MSRYFEIHGNDPLKLCDIFAELNFSLYQGFSMKTYSCVNFYPVCNSAKIKPIYYPLLSSIRAPYHKCQCTHSN